MTSLRPSERAQIIQLVRRIAVLEYALVEACNDDARHASDYEQAQMLQRLSTAQVHLFDLGTALRELGDESLNYSRCMRQALLETGSSAEIVGRLERAYQRVLERSNLQAGLSVLLRANLADYRGLDGQQQLSAAFAA